MVSNIEDVYSLTPMQNGILYHTLRAETAGPYVEQFVFDVRGEVDPSRLVQAWAAVLRRHPALRTAFVWEGVDEPVQVVVDAVDVPLAEVDLTGHPADRFPAKLRSWLAADRARGLSLTAAPLMRLALIHHDGGRIVVWTLHHLIMDGWSMPVTIGEVAAAYRALADGSVLRLPPARPFRDFVAWLATCDTAAAEGFWRQRLAGAPPADTALLGRGPADVRAGQAAGGRAYHDLSADLSAALVATARSSRVTVSTLFQAAWGLLLARELNVRDVVFGATVSGRPSELPGVEDIVGVFINTIPQRIEVDDRAGVAAWLREIQRRHLDTMPHQHLGLTRIQAAAGIPAATPLFESIVVFENYPSENPAFDLGAESALVLREVIEDAGYPLTLTVLPRSPRNRLQLLYAVDLFDDETATALLGRFDAMLAGLTAAPDGTVGQLTGGLPAADGRHVGGGAAPAPAVPAPVIRHGDDDFFTRPAAGAMRMLWTEVLGRDIHDPDSDFFRLGGDSLAAVRLIGRLRSVLPNQVEVGAVFEERTLRRLLERVESELGGAAEADRAAVAHGQPVV